MNNIEREQKGCRRHVTSEETCESIKYMDEAEVAEREELLEWIPKLANEYLNELTTDQLRILHYIMGYQCKAVTKEFLIEYLEDSGYSYDMDRVLEVFDILQWHKFLILLRPYY